MRTIVFSAVFFILSGCSTITSRDSVIKDLYAMGYQDPSYNYKSGDFSIKTYTAPQDASSVAVSMLRNMMKDPDSVIVRNIVARGREDVRNKWTICGEYNAKNSYGGYVGYERFAFDESVKRIFIDSSSSDVVTAYCGSSW